MTRHTLALTGVLALLIGLPGCPPAPTPPEDQDAAFMRSAAQSNLAEIQLGLLAVQRAVDNDVVAYGQRMIDDHRAANQDLRNLAEARDVVLPVIPNPQQLAISSLLGGLSGEEFDRQYLEANIDAHEQAIALFEAEVVEGDDPDVIAYAQQLLPILRDHLADARALLLQVGQVPDDDFDGNNFDDVFDDDLDI